MDEPLAVLVACACDEGFLEELEQLIERCGGSTASVRRRFGSCEGGHPPRQFGNKATYLQSSAVATPSREGGSLADALWRRTQSADVWGVTTKAAQRSRGFVGPERLTWFLLLLRESRSQKERTQRVSVPEVFESLLEIRVSCVRTEIYVHDPV